MFDRMPFDPPMRGGRACIRGRRMPVSVVMGQLAHGATLEEVLREYPDLEQEEITQALASTAWLAYDEVYPVSHALRFLADMGVSQRVVTWLHAQGHDAIHLRDEGFQRLANGAIFPTAFCESRLILTWVLDCTAIAQCIAVCSASTRAEASCLP